MFTDMFENKINRKMENPYANVLHLSLFHFFESLFIIVLSPSFFFKIYCLLV